MLIAFLYLISILPESFSKQVAIDDKVSLLDIYDAGGQRDQTCTLRPYQVQNGKGFLLVYSITSRDSFEMIRGFHEYILNVKDKDTFSTIIVANKSDLESERQVENSGKYQSLCQTVIFFFYIFD
jgi:GTPase KRas